MGYSVTWTAVRGKTPESVLEALRLARTGRKNDDGVTSRTPFAWSELKGGWVLVLANAGAADHRFLDDAGRGDAFLASLSAGCEIVACFVEEHVMVSRATSWKDGVRGWDVKHDGQTGLDHLERVGAAPAGAENAEAEARTHLANDSDPCDYLFDVPVTFANAVVPYRYDTADCAYEELEHASGSARPSFISRLFGR